MFSSAMFRKKFSKVPGRSGCSGSLAHLLFVAPAIIASRKTFGEGPPSKTLPRGRPAPGR